MLAVTTRTSTYLVNEEEGWIQRVPGNPDDVNGDQFFVAALRKDGDRIPLLEISPIEVGKDMIMMLDIVGDGVTVTHRRTTPVKEIVDVTAPEDSHERQS